MTSTTSSRVLRRPAMVGSALALGLMVAVPASLSYAEDKTPQAMYMHSANVESSSVDAALVQAQAIAEAQAQAEAEAAAAAAEAQRIAEEQARNARHIPTSNYSLTARYGQSGGWSSGYHTGLDFAAPSGTAVVAAQSGTVTAAGYNGAYGNQVTIQHADGTVTTYAHLSSISVSAGQSVGGGERIGAVGSTGNSTGPHLHFEVLVGGSFTNPAAWLGL